MVTVGLNLVTHMIIGIIVTVVIMLHYTFLLVVHQKVVFTFVLVIPVPILLLYNDFFLNLFVKHLIVVTFSNNPDRYNITPINSYTELLRIEPKKITSCTVNSINHKTHNDTFKTDKS